MFYDKEFLGNKFKEYRKNANLTQEALAEKIGIAEKHYGKLERGAFVPSLETFFKLVEVLKIPFSEFGFNLPDYKDDLKEISRLLLDEAKLIEGLPIEDTARFVELATKFIAE